MEVGGFSTYEGKAFYNTPWLDNYDGDFVIINDILLLYRGSNTEVTIPEGIRIIGFGAFQYCDFIKNVDIPFGVREIGLSTFEGCESLEEINLPDSVEIIDAYAFYGCKNLATLSVPKNIYIGQNAFAETKWMDDYQGDFVILSNNLLTYKGNDSSITIPDSVKTVCTNAFSFNNDINEVIVPKNVEIIRYAGFFFGLDYFYKV